MRVEEKHGKGGSQYWSQQDNYGSQFGIRRSRERGSEREPYGLPAITSLACVQPVCLTVPMEVAHNGSPRRAASTGNDVLRRPLGILTPDSRQDSLTAARARQL